MNEILILRCDFLYIAFTCTKEKRGNRFEKVSHVLCDNMFITQFWTKSVRLDTESHSYQFPFYPYNGLKAKVLI